MNSTENGQVAFAALQNYYDPWNWPEDLILLHYAPEDIRSFLHPHWHNFKAIYPVWYYALGLAYVFLGATSVTGNFMVIHIFFKFQELRRPSNMLVINLAISDFLLMACLIPESTFNFFLGGPWRFGELGCQIHAFLGALFGYVQIWTLTAISYDRFNVIVRGFNGKPFTYCKAVVVIFLIWAWSIGWSVCPLVGWGYYAMDGMMGSCSFDMVTKDLSNETHILATTIACYIFPVAVIAGCYWYIVKAVFHHEKELRDQAKKMNVTSLRSNVDQQQVSAEIRIAKVAITNVCLWLFAWTPFVVVCMIGMYGDQGLLTPMVSNLPVLLAKTSSVYNPIIYAISHPKYKECLRQVYPWICGGGAPDSKLSRSDSETQSVSSDRTEMTTKS